MGVRASLSSSMQLLHRETTVGSIRSCGIDVHTIRGGNMLGVQ